MHTMFFAMGLSCLAWTCIQIYSLTRPRVMCRPLKVAAWDKRTGELIEVEWV